MSNLPPPDGGPPPAWSAPPPPPPAAPPSAWAPAPPAAPPTQQSAWAPTQITPAAAPPPDKSRRPLVVGAVVAALVAVGAFAWTKQSNDDGSVATDPSVTAPAASSLPGTAVPGATVPPSGSTVPATGATLTLPTAPPATVPAVTVAPPPPPVSIPPGSVLASDPAGWSMAVDPAWNDTTADGVRTLFITPGATAGDNVNVSTEVLPSDVGIDAYITAAIANIQTAAPDFQIVTQRREVGADGVQVEVITWVGTLSGLPKLSFLQSIMVSPSHAYIATFTSTPETMPTMAPFLEPFLVTLRGT